MLLKVGDKVRLKWGVPIENQELAPGRIGTVTAVDLHTTAKPWEPKIERVVVKLDEPVKCLDEWNNEIHYDLGNWCDEPSVEHLIMHALELIAPVDHPIVLAARTKWYDYLTECLNDAYIKWRKEARRDFEDAELDIIARMAHKNYMEEDPCAAFPPKPEKKS